ncbi:MAG TPA: hypothetical protein VIH57_16540 [Bacteroidales bacterium]
MKKLILNTIFLFSFTGLYPQKLSIELSIEWKQEVGLLKDIYQNGCNNSCIPYLSITYRNNSDDSVYFLKPSASERGFPPIMSVIFNLSENKNDTTAESFPNYSGKEYYVYIYNSPDCGKIWEVTSDTNILSQGHTQEQINEELAEVHRLFDRQSDSDIDTLYFNCPSKKEDMEEETLLIKYKSNFIFLKKGEVFTEKYNLIGFYILGGNFEFGIHPDYLHDFIYGEESWDKKQEIWVFKKMPLPEHLNGYKLYSNSFLTNTVSLKVKNHPFFLINQGRKK